MALYNPKKLFAPYTATASSAIVYTVPASTTAVLKELVLVNITTTTQTVTVHCIPSGDSAGVANMLMNAVAVAPNSFEPVSFGQVLATGDKISILASATSSIVVHGSGIEIS